MTLPRPSAGAEVKHEAWWDGLWPPAFQLWSAWDMIRFKAADIAEIAKTLEGIGIVVGAMGADAYHTPMGPPQLKPIERALAVCDGLGLKQSSTLARRLIGEAQRPPVPTIGEFALRVHTLLERIQDELGDLLAVRIPADRARHYEQPCLFGDAVAAAFPAAAADIEEAGNCYATGRNTAAVFHLMRAMEVALRALGRDVGASEHNPTWNAVLDKVSGRLKLAHDKGGWPSAERQRYAEADTTLRAVQLAWRNTSMHVDRVYEDRKVKQILDAVEHFMQHLATWLHE